mmetsp:Transcript_103263/g.301229  ORF Transcript_103263/g.301229 Transcript_103263/m.301229 type:complete len:233 (+) Transcript_103263:419-1117(+)
MDTRGHGLPSDSHSIFAPSGTWAILCRASLLEGCSLAGSEVPLPLLPRCSVSIWKKRGSSTSGQPNAAATPAMVRSSCVGPRPPEENTSSQASETRRTLAAMASISSGTTSTHVTRTPRPCSSSQMCRALASCTLPLRISLPTTTTPAVLAALMLRDRGTGGSWAAASGAAAGCGAASACSPSLFLFLAPLLDTLPARSSVASSSSHAGAYEPSGRSRAGLGKVSSTLPREV